MPAIGGRAPPWLLKPRVHCMSYSGSSLSRSFPGNGTARLALSADACRPSFSPCVLSARARDRAVCLVRADAPTSHQERGPHEVTTVRVSPPVLAYAVRIARVTIKI